jgi:flagellar basal body-associated protein FliL
MIWVQSQSNKPKKHWITKKRSLNWINIYVLPSNAMAIMASFFFHSFECQGVQTQNPFDEILILSFDLGPLKVNTYGVRQESILQRTIKRIHIIKHI